MADRLNFSQVTALVLDGDRYSSDIIGQILLGFGLSHCSVVGTVAAAKKLLEASPFQLIITEACLADATLSDFVGWIRHNGKGQLRYIPVVVLTSYADYSRVTLARDAGVNSVVCKPVSPAILFDHIAWASHTDRPFIEADEYAGPCRRFHREDMPAQKHRRNSDRIDGDEIRKLAQTAHPEAMH